MTNTENLTIDKLCRMYSNGLDNDSAKAGLKILAFVGPQIKICEEKDVHASSLALRDRSLWLTTAYGGLSLEVGIHRQLPCNLSARSLSLQSKSSRNEQDMNAYNNFLYANETSMTGLYAHSVLELRKVSFQTNRGLRMIRQVLSCPRNKKVKNP